MDNQPRTDQELVEFVKDLDIRVVIPRRRYVRGRGFVSRDEQHRYDVEVRFQWGKTDPSMFYHIGPQLYDLELHLGEETLKQFPNLFYLYNGLPNTDEVEIPDTGYEGRDFYIVNRTIVVTNMTLQNFGYLTRTLMYMVKVLTEKSMLVASRRDTSCPFSEADARLLTNVVDGNSAKKHANALRQLAARIESHIAGQTR